MLYFEDFPAGDIHEWGNRKIGEDEIIAFARRYDPQPMHTDPVAARDTMLGGLAASGWHTAALTMRMVCDEFMLDSASLGSPGVPELDWERPVRPGDTLRVRRTVLEARRSQSRPDMGIVNFLFEVFNQDGTRVMRMTAAIMLRTRPEKAA